MVDSPAAITPRSTPDPTCIGHHMDLRGSTKRARDGDEAPRRHGGYCPYCFEYFTRYRELETHWHRLVKRHPKQGQHCSTAARDCRDATKTSFEAFARLAGRARFGVRPAAGVHADGVGAAYEGDGGGGGDGAATTAHGDDRADEDMMVDDGGGEDGGDSSDGGGGNGGDSSDGGRGDGDAIVDFCGASTASGDAGIDGLDGDVDERDGGSGDGQNVAGGRPGIGQGGAAHRQADDDESSFGGASSDELVEVGGDDAGYGSFESWAGAHEDFGQWGDDDDAQSSHDEEEAGEAAGQQGDAERSGDDAGHGADPVGEGNSSDGGPSPGAGPGELPPADDPGWLHNVHRGVAEQLGATVMEGGPTRTKQRHFGNKNQDYRPFFSLTELNLFVFGVAHQLSGAAMTDLFDMLTFVDGQEGDGAGEGRGFNIADIPKKSRGQKFISRMREYLPLFEVWMRDVVAKPKKKKSGSPTTAKVYDIPITQVLASMLKSRAYMEKIFSNPGGAVVGMEEGQQIGLAGDHPFPLPTRPARNARRNNMHGTLVQRMPQHSFDGFLAAARTKIYVGDVVMCDLREAGSPNPLQVPCRVTAAVFVEESRRLIVTVRRFRNAHEVLGVAYGSGPFVRDGLVRVWEEVGSSSEIDLRDASQVLDLIEVFTTTEVRTGAHRLPWVGAGTRREGWSFVGEGFVTWRGDRFVKKRDRFKLGWRRAGSEEENYLDMRGPDVKHNVWNLKFLNLSIGFSADDFNAFNYNTPVSHVVPFSYGFGVYKSIYYCAYPTCSYFVCRQCRKYNLVYKYLPPPLRDHAF